MDLLVVQHLRLWIFGVLSLLRHKKLGLFQPNRNRHDVALLDESFPPLEVGLQSPKEQRLERTIGCMGRSDPGNRG